MLQALPIKEHSVSQSTRNVQSQTRMGYVTPPEMNTAMPGLLLIFYQASDLIKNFPLYKKTSKLNQELQIFQLPTVMVLKRARIERIVKKVAVKEQKKKKNLKNIHVKCASLQPQQTHHQQGTSPSRLPSQETKKL